MQASKTFSPAGDISALIGITGSNGEGMVSISFPLDLGREFISRLLSREVSTLTDEQLNDGVGEVVNMISGGAKSILSQEMNSAYKLSIPSVVRGDGHKIAGCMQGKPYLVLTFQTEDNQEFYIHVAFKLND